jgi:hypothetical protein
MSSTVKSVSKTLEAIRMLHGSQDAQKLMFKRLVSAGFDHTAKTMHKTLFRSAIGYKGSLPLDSNTQEIQSKEDLKSAIFSFLDNQIITFSFRVGTNKYASKTNIVEKKHKDFADQYRAWYKDSFKIWKEIIEQGQKVENVTLGTFAKYLLEHYRNDSRMDDLVKFGIEKFREKASDLIIILDNFSEEAKNKEPLSSIYRDLVISESKLRDSDEFITRLFLNILLTSRN